MRSWLWRLPAHVIAAQSEVLQPGCVRHSKANQLSTRVTNLRKYTPTYAFSTHFDARDHAN